MQNKFLKSDAVFPLRPWAGAGAFPVIQEGVYKIYHRNNKIYNCRCKLWVQPYPGSTAQVAWQANYRAGVTAYWALTDEQRAEYKRRTEKSHYTGFNLFMKEYLLAL